MSYHLNRFMLIGNVTKLPERRTTKKGHDYCLLFLAQTKKWTTASGEKKDAVLYFNLNVYAKIGEILLDSDIQVGDKIFVEGDILPHKIEGEDGSSYFSHQFSVNNFSFLERHNTDTHYSTPQQRAESMREAQDDFSDLDL